MCSSSTVKFERDPPGRNNLFQKGFCHQRGSSLSTRESFSSVRKHTVTKTFLESMRWEKLQEIHLLNLKFFFKQFKMSLSGVNSYSLNKWGTGGEVGIHCSFINISTPTLIHECYFLVGQSFNACTILMSGNFRVYSITKLLFGLLYKINKTYLSVFVQNSITQGCGEP